MMDELVEQAILMIRVVDKLAAANISHGGVSLNDPRGSIVTHSGYQWWINDLSPSDRAAAIDAVISVNSDPSLEDTNEKPIRDVLLTEIDAMLTEADALQAILDQWGVTPPNNAAVLAHLKRVTRDLIRLARDVVRLVRLELRKLDAV